MDLLLDKVKGAEQNWSFLPKVKQEEERKYPFTEDLLAGCFRLVLLLSWWRDTFC